MTTSSNDGKKPFRIEEVIRNSGQTCYNVGVNLGHEFWYTLYYSVPTLEEAYKRIEEYKQNQVMSRKYIEVD